MPLIYHPAAGARRGRSSTSPEARPQDRKEGRRLQRSHRPQPVQTASLATGR